MGGARRSDNGSRYHRRRIRLWQRRRAYNYHRCCDYNYHRCCDNNYPGCDYNYHGIHGTVNVADNVPDHDRHINANKHKDNDTNINTEYDAHFDRDVDANDDAGLFGCSLHLAFQAIRPKTL